MTFKTNECRVSDMSRFKVAKKSRNETIQVEASRSKEILRINGKGKVTAIYVNLTDRNAELML